VPDSRVAFSRGAGPDKRSYRVAFGKLRALLPGAEPRWTVRDGIEEMYEAYRAAGLSIEDLSGSSFTRIEQVKLLMAEGRLDASLRPLT
jgi:hypothetical protein